MTLDSLTPRSPALVQGFVDGSEFSISLMELGVVPGTRVEIIRRAPLGDPLEIDVTGARLAIRRSVAASIIVSKA